MMHLLHLTLVAGCAESPRRRTAGRPVRVRSLCVPLLLAGSLLVTEARAACAQVTAPQRARAAGAGANGAGIDSLAIRAHTRFLADDMLAGRGTGTEGERLAAAYIVSQLERLGLEPLSDDRSFMLPMPLRRARIDDATQVTIAARTGTRTFRNTHDFIVNTGGAGAFRDFEGRAFFLGQAVHAGARAPAVPAGGVAVFLGPLGGSAVELVPALVEAGVTGVVVLVPDTAQYDLYVRSRGDTRYFVDAPVDDPVWQPTLPVLIAGPVMTEALLADGDVPPAIGQGEEGPGADLGRVITATIRADIATVFAANIGAALPGSDPELRDEFVVYTAHYDHLGISTPDAAGDSIYNGFSDNAAGVAMLLAIAEAMREAPPARSVAFLFFTGEERGLLGSAYMASASPLPLDRIAALINLDAGAPPAPPLNWRIAGGEGVPLGTLAASIAEQHGWSAALSAASPNSDYWPFLQRGVPSIFIIPGDRWENTTTDERDALRRRWDRYHQAGDHWHPDFPFSGLHRYATFALAVGMATASHAW
ncbi:MAG: M28 family peptidase [Gemmatimonadetes bacterium]|nr:M28 family peptidase [Gemmatimonadota bacterium]